MPKFSSFLHQNLAKMYKNIFEKAYFNKHLEWAAPTLWSKYTTFRIVENPSNYSVGYQVSELACIIEGFYANLLDDLFLGFEGKLSIAFMGTRQKVIGQLSLNMLNGVPMFYSATKYIFKMIFTDSALGTI